MQPALPMNPDSFLKPLMRNRDKSWKNRKTREFISMLFRLKGFGIKDWNDSNLHAHTCIYTCNHTIFSMWVACTSSLVCVDLLLYLCVVAQCPEDEDSIRSWWVCSTRPWKIPEFPHSHWLPLSNLKQQSNSRADAIFAQMNTIQNQVWRYFIKKALV